MDKEYAQFYAEIILPNWPDGRQNKFKPSLASGAVHHSVVVYSLLFVAPIGVGFVLGPCYMAWCLVFFHV